MAAPSLHTFIVSWTGKHEKASMIARAVMTQSSAVTVVYSDGDEKNTPKFPCPSLRRPNALLWEDKFRAALHACRSELMLIIHSDCETDNWAAVPAACKKAYADHPRTGVWCPLIDGTIYNINHTLIHNIKDTPYSVVTQTDGIVFAISRPIMERMKKATLDKNPHGWGIDTMVNCYSYSKGLLSLVDHSVPVHHPRGSGYDRTTAHAQMHTFLEQLSPEEEIIYHFMRTVQRYASDAHKLKRDSRKAGEDNAATTRPHSQENSL